MDNPYAAPAAPVLMPVDVPLGERSPAQIRKLYYRSANADAIAFLMILGIAFMVFAMVTTMGEGNPIGAIGIGVIIAFYLVAAVFILRRSATGRILGIIACALMMVNIPLGTLIGIIGLFAFIGGKELFGPSRIPRAAVKAAYKALKAEAKAAKAAAKAAARAGR